MTRNFFVMAFGLLVGCGNARETMDTADLTMVGSHVDAAECAGERSAYTLIMSELGQHPTNTPLVDLANSTLLPLSDEDSLAKCFSMRELRDLHLAHRDLVLDQVYDRVTDRWSECRADVEVGRAREANENLRWGAASKMMITLDIGDPDELDVIRVFAAANCNLVDPNKVDPGSFDRTLFNTGHIQDDDLRNSTISDVISTFYRTYYWGGTDDEVAAQEFMKSYPLSKWHDPKQFARTMSEIGKPLRFSFYEDWGVDQEEVVANLVKLLQHDPLLGAHLQKAGYPAATVSRAAFDLLIESRKYRQAALVAQENLGAAEVEEAWRAFIAEADKNMTFSVLVDEHGKMSKHYDWTK